MKHEAACDMLRNDDKFCGYQEYIDLILRSNNIGDFWTCRSQK